MRSVSKYVLGISMLCGALTTASAGTLTDISFKSNGLSYINNTLVGDGTSPLAFTAATGLDAPFLNASDSTISLGYGTYYAIAFLGFGQHIGAGQISFFSATESLSYSLNVTFPDPASASGVFATFNLAGGDTVTIAATGLKNDRISIIADGGGLTPDGTPDAFYTFKYTNASVSAVPEPASGAMLAGGLAMVGFMLQRRRS